MAAVDTVKGRYSSYKLLNEVGHGGSARVFRAQDVVTQRKVAVKQLFGNRLQDREDWLREVDALNALNNHHCPHVIQYLDHMQQHGKLFLVEEYAERGSLLRQLRQDGPMTEGVACNIVFQILTTLHRMSQWNIIHGDLKASNILLFDGEMVKLTDFALHSHSESKEGSGGSNIHCNLMGSLSIGGDDADVDNEEESNSPPANLAATRARLALSLAGASSGSRLSCSATPQRTGAATGAAAAAAVVEGTDEGSMHSARAVENLPSVISPPALIEFRGSVYWAAPEVLAGESCVTAASDIWSVGCTTIELLTGAPPYFDRSMPNATHHVLKYYYAVIAGQRMAAVDTQEETEEGGDSEAPAVVSTATKSEQQQEQQGWERSKRSARCDKQTEGERDADGGGGNARAADAEEFDSLMPPLPDTLHLSEECLSFLRLCLRLRPAERPSAGELLQHPWLWNVVVPQLLQAARDGRGMGNSPGEEDGVHNNTNNNSSSNSGANNSSNVGSRFAVIEKWVELNLRSDQESRCRAWLKGDALPLLVPALTPRIMTPKYIGNVMRCFSHFAETDSALVPLFLNRLGATELWSVEELTSACDADHLVTLFRRCCDVQDPQVQVFTPTHPSALRFMLGLEKAKVEELVAALHRLLVDGEPPRHQAEPSAGVAAPVAAANTATSPLLRSGDHMEKEEREKASSASAETPHPDEAMEQSATWQRQQERCERARERLLRDGGAAVLCQRVESQCKAAFLSSAPPTLESSTIRRFFEILEVVEPLPGGQSLLWGFPSEDSVGSPSTRAGVAGLTSAASLMTPHSDAVVNSSSNKNHASTLASAAMDNSATTPLTSPLPVTPRESMSPTNNTYPSAHTTVAAPAPVALANTSSNINGSAAMAHNAASSHFGSGSFIVHAEGEWTSSLSWMLAVQESAHHCCEAAVRLLTRYIPLATEVRAEYLDKAGLSLAATLALVASNECMSTELRCAAVGCLPKLQANSLRAARYLRDPIRCIPLLSLTLKRSALSQELATSILAALRALTTEKQTLAACVSSPWVWDALLTLLDELAAQGNKSKAKGNGERSVAPRHDKNRSDDVSSTSSSPPSPAAPHTPAQRVLGITDDPKSHPTPHRHDGNGASSAMLASILALISQWFADVSPTALVSMATTAVGANRSMAFPPPPSSSAPSASTHMHPSSRQCGSTNPAVPPSLPALLQRLYVQLKDLLRNEAICRDDVLPHVDKALEYLAPLEGPLPAASAAAK
ncbi:putative protein kinase [Leptomonas seymouri]|uniref:non-specific serine/threonine protein kinase n=1 Tax=Leptomonas seymouri TaxID=5684 RepID=A0A0N1PDC8_LEPSE|nr:putative protein kinase [Leptomonas seymouri]|eukprot:KPI89533.1 putative protein kinase [Leptomonas seymouri]